MRFGHIISPGLSIFLIAYEVFIRKFRFKDIKVKIYLQICNVLIMKTFGPIMLGEEKKCYIFLGR